MLYMYLGLEAVDRKLVGLTRKYKFNNRFLVTDVVLLSVKYGSSTESDFHVVMNTRIVDEMDVMNPIFAPKDLVGQILF